MERKLLIIDDYLQRILKLKESLPPNITIHRVFNIQDASYLLSKDWFSVVVITVAKEREACFTFLSELRMVRPMPIIAAGTASLEERVHAYRLGADQCVDAPIEVEELVEAILASPQKIL